MAERDYADTGYGPIDVEHRAISGTIGALLGAVNAGALEEARSHGRALLSSVRAHFAHEERLMAEHGYPKLAPHRDAHELFLSDAAHFVAELEGQGLTVRFRRWATGRLSEWFRFHIMRQDVELGLHLCGVRAPVSEARAAPRP